MFWYCAEVESSRMPKAEMDLKNMGFRTFQPTCLEKRWRLRSRRHETVIAPLFPGYLFVEYDPYCQVFQHILKARGVIGLVKGAGSEMPARVNPRAMARLLEMAKAGPLREDRWLRAFAEGTEVRVVRDGPWLGWAARVRRSLRGRVWVLMRLFGAEREVELPEDALEAA